MKRGFGDYGDPYLAIAGLMALTNMAIKRKNSRTPEEQAKHEEFKKKLQEQRERDKRNLFISKGICPSCMKKLIRGKKDKDHIRRWQCSNPECGAVWEKK